MFLCELSIHDGGGILLRVNKWVVTLIVTLGRLIAEFDRRAAFATQLIHKDSVHHSKHPRPNLVQGA
jgi:hypothetical protein